MWNVENLIPIEDPALHHLLTELTCLPCSVIAVCDPETVRIADDNNLFVGVTFHCPLEEIFKAWMARILLVMVEIVGL